MKSTLRPALTLFIVLTLLCGVLYPLLVTAVGKLCCAKQAAGSLLFRAGQPIGSLLIGQSFSSPRYFWGRPSATTPMPNNPLASTGSNLAVTNPALVEAIKQRIHALQVADPSHAAPIPVDLVSASASGLDPDISVAAAIYQVGRIVRQRQLSYEEVHRLIDQHSHRPYLGFLGEPRVNVLALNLALDAHH
ncbi:MAG: potassium-transporting ATPase subunit KdpC [Ottowia sp.]|nr:potassium-transporting ATPase subunit KdpC [Ottowia sp.]